MKKVIKQNENKFADEALGRIVDFLRRKDLRLSKTSDDGRLNLAINESQILNDLKSLEYSSEWFQEHGLKILEPKSREWFDFAIENVDEGIFIPINIKVSKCGKSQADNLNCKLGIFYALTGMLPSSANIAQGTDWDKYFKSIDQYMGKRIDRDYYFLVVNKDIEDDVFYSSLCSLKSLRPNGNNLPFQCKWDDNRERIERTYEEAQRFILSSFQDSLNKRIQIAESFDKYVAKYIVQEESMTICSSLQKEGE